MLKFWKKNNFKNILGQNMFLLSGVRLLIKSARILGVILRMSGKFLILKMERILTLSTFLWLERMIRSFMTLLLIKA